MFLDLLLEVSFPNLAQPRILPHKISSAQIQSFTPTSMYIAYDISLKADAVTGRVQGGDLGQLETQDFFYLQKGTSVSFNMVVVQNELSLNQVKL